MANRGDTERRFFTVNEIRIGVQGELTKDRERIHCKLNAGRRFLSSQRPHLGGSTLRKREDQNDFGGVDRAAALSSTGKEALERPNRRTVRKMEDSKKQRSNRLKSVDEETPRPL